jgi:hypothetical protein
MTGGEDVVKKKKVGKSPNPFFYLLKNFLTLES